MRLIDVDNYKGKVIASHCYSGVNKLINVDEIPTAYDVDKVVEKLEIEKDNPQGSSTSETINARMWNKAMQRAIEIVKGGGIVELSKH